MTKRIKLAEGAPVYHCIGRIVGGDMVLGDEEKEFFRRLMWRVAEFSGMEIITYCVMTNHVHLLIRVPVLSDLSDEEICRRLVRYYGKREPWVQLVTEGVKRGGCLSVDLRRRLVARMGDVSVFMRTLKQRFSRWYNKKHDRFGTLWAERFKSVLVEEDAEALRTIAMYIDLNPVRAGLVDDPMDYPFCGHAEALGGNSQLRREVVRLCEERSWREAAAEYRQIMIVYAGGDSRPDKRALTEKQIQAVLKSGGEVAMGDLLRLRWRYFSDGLAFGSREFVEGVFARFRDRFGERRVTGARRLRGVGGELSKYSTLRDLQKNTAI